MPRPRSIAKIIAALKMTEAEKAVVRELLKVDPRIEKLNGQRAAILEELEAVDAEIAVLSGETPVKGKRGRKPGKKKATPAQLAALKRARAARAAKAAPKRRGRPVGSGKVAKAKSVRTPEQQAIIDARMAKARAARKTTAAKG